MDNFDEELAVAELADAMRVQFGNRALTIAEEQARAATSGHAEKAWRRIALKLRRWQDLEPDDQAPDAAT
jgi:hypothetical protein